MIKKIKKLNNTQLVTLFKDVRRTYNLNEFKEYVPSANTMEFLVMNDIKIDCKSISELENLLGIEILKRVFDGRISVNK